MKRAIVTVGVSEGGRWFKPYLERFHNTFREHGGADYLKIWHREWPPGSPPHSACHYAFKVHAVRDAVTRGCVQVLWFDASCWATKSLHPLWERLERVGHLLVHDDNALGSWSSDHSLAEFGVSRDDAMRVKLMSGTCWGVDVSSWKSRLFLEVLHRYAVPEHFNGTHVSRQPGAPKPATEGACMSTDERCRGHRSDEVYMSLLARELGMRVHGWVETEFVGGNGNPPHAAVFSGYNLPMPDDRDHFAATGAKMVNGVLDYCDGVDYR